MPEKTLPTQITLPQNIPKFINEKQVMEITDIGLQTLRNDRSGPRRIPYYEIGKSVRYRLTDVLDFMESRRISSREEAK
jgi:hypothetical protein